MTGRFLSLLALGLLSLALLVAAPRASQAEDPYIVLASTTSTQNSGLFDHLLPRFTAASGIAVRVVAVGTGQALRLAANCDADALLVHHRASEERFVAEGHGLARHDVMYNDFVLLGPSEDPAGIAGESDIAAALAGIAAAEQPFLSRGDDSGTHKTERALWQAAGVAVDAASGTWYRETGAGMGATLNTAAAMAAYALSDRATWLAFANKGPLAVLSEGDARLFNPYGVIAVDPAACPTAKTAEAERFIAWLVSAEGQGAIADYRRDGQQLFFPNAAGQ
jgi:tungstate transport system substrate-binding protein